MEDGLIKDNYYICKMRNLYISIALNVVFTVVIIFLSFKGKKTETDLRQLDSLNIVNTTKIVTIQKESEINTLKIDSLASSIDSATVIIQSLTDKKITKSDINDAREWIRNYNSQQ